MIMGNENKALGLDLKDRKILFELDFNARQTNTEIAKKVGLSKQGVDYRIKNLLKNGVITGFYPVIDNMKLGYIYGRVFIKPQNLTKEGELKVLESLAKERKINWILKSEGNYEILFASWQKTLGSFKQLTRDIVSRYSRYIKDIRESVGIRVVHYRSRFLMEKEGVDKLVFEETPVRVIVDALDKRILKALCRDARASLVDIASNLRISPKVLAYRIKKLENSKVILGYRPLINYSILGYTYYKILFHLMNVTKEGFESFRRYMENHPKVLFIIDEVGICDIDIELILESEQDYFVFMKTLKSKFPTLVKEYETLVGLENLKVNYLPFDL